MVREPATNGPEPVLTAQTPAPTRSAGAAALGALLLCASHAACVGVLTALGRALSGTALALPGDTVPVFLATIGLSQLPYGVPLWLWQRKQGRDASARGVWIAMGLTLALNAACWGIAMADFRTR